MFRGHHIWRPSSFFMTLFSRHKQSILHSLYPSSIITQSITPFPLILYGTLFTSIPFTTLKLLNLIKIQNEAGEFHVFTTVDQIISIFIENKRININCSKQYVYTVLLVVLGYKELRSFIYQQFTICKLLTSACGCGCGSNRWLLLLVCLQSQGLVPVTLSYLLSFSNPLKKGYRWETQWKKSLH